MLSRPTAVKSCLIVVSGGQNERASSMSSKPARAAVASLVAHRPRRLAGGPSRPRHRLRKKPGFSVSRQWAALGGGTYALHDTGGTWRPVKVPFVGEGGALALPRTSG